MATVDLTVAADLSALRKQLGEIPGIGADAAAKMTAEPQQVDPRRRGRQQEGHRSQQGRRRQSRRRGASRRQQGEERDRADGRGGWRPGKQRGQARRRARSPGARPRVGGYGCGRHRGRWRGGRALRGSPGYGTRHRGSCRSANRRGARRRHRRLRALFQGAGPGDRASRIFSTVRINDWSIRSTRYGMPSWTSWWPAVR